MLEALLVPPPMSAERLGEAVAGLSGLVGFVVIPMFANWVFGNSTKVGHTEQMSSNWDVDGMRFIERWWFV